MRRKKAVRTKHKYNKACHGCGEQADVELEDESDYCSVCIKAGYDIN